MIARIGSPIPFVSREKFGGKGKNLLELGEEFPVPEGFVVSSEDYVDFFMRNSLRDVIEKVMKDHKDFQEIEKRIRESFLKGDFSGSLEDALKKELERLQIISPKDPQAVRSSGVDEDGSSKSFAGQHDSFFGKLDENTLFEYLKRCYASSFNAVALKYRQDHGLELPKGMAVVIQNMKQFEVGFVAYTAAPFDFNQMLIEAAPGHCKSVVDGRAVDSFRISTDTYSRRRTIDKKPNKNKQTMWQYDVKQGKLVLVPVPKKFIKTECLTDEQIQEIADVIEDIEKCYALGYPDERKPQDIEGGFDYNGRLWITQSRDITGMSFKAPDIVLPDLNKLIGQSYNVGNAGIYEGPVVIVTNVDPNGTDFTLKGIADIKVLDARYSSGYILVTPETNPTLDYYLNNCKAIVATECGIMSHAGATARERGLIFVGCVESTDKSKLQDKLKHGDVVVVGANKEKGIVGYR